MGLDLIKLIIYAVFLGILTACQPGGDTASSFGTKIPDRTGGSTTGGNNGNPSANLVSIVSGDKQNVAVGGRSSIPLVVLVLQAPGQAVANETVYFQVVGGASRGTVSAASAITNSSGYAEIYFTGGSFIGDVNIVASAPQGSVNFITTVTGATGFSLSKTASNSGEGQVGNINTTLGQRLKVLLTDSYGEPVPNQNVRFASVGSVQGTFSGAAYYDSMTNANGVAESALLTLSPVSGTHSINAYLTGDSSVNTTFSAVSTTPSNSTIDPFKSKLILSHAVVAADGMFVVEASVEIRDVFDNLIPNNSYAVSVTSNPSDLYLWNGSGWTYHAPGIYKRSLTVKN